MPRGTISRTRFSRDYASFLRLLRDQRIRAGLTQIDAAKRLRRPQSFVSKCESGERRVDVVELAAFCRAYRVELGRFVRQMKKP
jgi:transcriptional regulator with XRE-family HTH domain